MTTLTERLDKLPPARRKKVKARARELVAEDMSLQDLRKERKQMQVRVFTTPFQLKTPSHRMKSLRKHFFSPTQHPIL